MNSYNFRQDILNLLIKYGQLGMDIGAQFFVLKDILDEVQQVYEQFISMNNHASEEKQQEEEFSNMEEEKKEDKSV